MRPIPSPSQPNGAGATGSTITRRIRSTWMKESDECPTFFERFVAIAWQLSNSISPAVDEVA